MRLTSITVQYFRNFVEPQTIEIEDDVTVLVGKNESGKTTILKALHRLNPANRVDVKFNLTIEYPRWRLSRDRRANPDLAQLAPISATFELDESDSEALGGVMNPPPPAGAVLTAQRRYDNTPTLAISVEPRLIIDAAAAATDVAGEDLEGLRTTESVDAAIAHAREQSKALKENPQASLRSKALASFASTATKYSYLQDDLEDDAWKELWAHLPKFFYFATYQRLPGECDLTALTQKLQGEETVTPAERTVLALLAHAGEGPQDFLDEQYESRKAELQAASLDLSRHAMEYWRQNPDLSVVFDTDMVEVDTTPTGQAIMHRVLKIELRDARHGDVETNLETRSAGFRWFFSFFAAFSEYQESEESLVVLLDEPGTSLHGDAQRDFVRFVAEELGASKQTIYTTHSQHMVDPSKYEQLRAVHDRATRDDPDLAVVVTRVDLSADRDTILPVESALGYSVSQHLFIGTGPHLAVEGSSDFIFLQRFTEHLWRHGSDQGLDPRFAIIPVGSADNMPAFVALMGRRLQISVLVDGARTSRTVARILAAATANDLDETKIVVCSDADENLPKNSDIEDLFDVDDYLRLYNWAFQASGSEDDLADTGEPLLRRMEKALGEFDHALPAHALTEHREEFFATVSSSTVDRFKKLFVLLNGTLPAS